MDVSLDQNDNVGVFLSTHMEMEMAPSGRVLKIKDGKAGVSLRVYMVMRTS